MDDSISSLLPSLAKANSVYTSSHTTEIAQLRKDCISDLLKYVEGNKIVRDASSTITFLYEDEKTLPNSSQSLDRADSLNINSHGGKIKMNLTIDDHVG
jgi:hypothetical protein